MINLVLGASPQPYRYSRLAVLKLRQKDCEVRAIGIKEGEIDDVKIETGKPHIDAVDTVLMYLRAERQKEFEDYILSLKPRRVIFNPGAENGPLEKVLRIAGIETVRDCSLVMLSTGSY